MFTDFDQLYKYENFTNVQNMEKAPLPNNLAIRNTKSLPTTSLPYQTSGSQRYEYNVKYLNINNTLDGLQRNNDIYSTNDFLLKFRRRKYEEEIEAPPVIPAEVFETKKMVGLLVRITRVEIPKPPQQQPVQKPKKRSKRLGLITSLPKVNRRR